MTLLNTRAWVLRAVSLSIVCLGFAQVAPAGMISTSQLVENEARAESLSRIEMLLAREDVTKQMVANFQSGGAAVNQICKTFDIGLKVFELALELPTRDISVDAALDEDECAATIAYGMEAIAGGCDLLCIGEMGIGNTTSATALEATSGSGISSDDRAPCCGLNRSSGIRSLVMPMSWW